LLQDSGGGGDEFSLKLSDFGLACHVHLPLQPELVPLDIWLLDMPFSAATFSFPGDAFACGLLLVDLLGGAL
jgi:hypothetical protein